MQALLAGVADVFDAAPVPTLIELVPRLVPFASIADRQSIAPFGPLFCTVLTIAVARSCSNHVATGCTYSPCIPYSP